MVAVGFAWWTEFTPTIWGGTLKATERVGCDRYSGEP
jgi:hypothetical protein